MLETSWNLHSNRLWHLLAPPFHLGNECILVLGCRLPVLTRFCNFCWLCNIEIVFSCKLFTILPKNFWLFFTKFNVKRLILDKFLTVGTVEMMAWTAWGPGVEMSIVAIGVTHSMENQEKISERGQRAKATRYGAAMNSKKNTATRCRPAKTSENTDTADRSR